MNSDAAKEVPGIMDTLVQALGQLPGVSAANAARMTLYLADAPEVEVRALQEALTAAQQAGRCPTCQGISDRQRQECKVCASAERDAGALCVVEQPSDVIAIERSGAYGGKYHVIDGLLSADGKVAVEDTNVPQLVQRVKDADGVVREVIVATDHSVDGDYTASYVADVMSRLPCPPLVTRPATGIPSGSGPDYVDLDTITRAVRDRRTA